MALDYRCIQCFEKSFTRLVNKYSLSKSNEAVFAVYFRQVLEKNTDLTTPEIQRLLQHKLRQLTGIKDPFEEEKLAGTILPSDFTISGNLRCCNPTIRSDLP